MKRIPFLIAAMFALPVIAAETLPPVPSASKLLMKKPVAEQVMPGLGVMPGDRGALKPNVIRVGVDRTEIVSISAQYPNRISTPFQNPRVIDQSDMDISPVGQSLYVTAKDPNKAVALFITGDRPNDPVVSVTLVPRNLPAQTVVLQMDTPAVGPDGQREEAPAGNVYSEKIRYMMRQVALGKVPEGFAEGSLPQSTARIGALVAVPVTRYSGPAYDIYKYRVQNASANQVELDEGAFSSDAVRAVAFFPTAVIGKGEWTTVFVISDKTANGN